MERPASTLLWLPGMKTVLLVDHDCLARARAERAFAPHREFQLLTASTYPEALGVLGEHDVDLAFVNLGLPQREGFELLAYLANCCPDVTVMTMSVPWGSDGEVAVLPWQGHLTGPLQAQALLSQARLEARERGGRRPMSLHDLLRVLSHERETCTLKVNAGPRSGQVQLFCGELIHATCDSAQGEQALVEMLCWQGVWLRVAELPSNPQVTLPHRLEQLLVEEPSRDLPPAPAPQLPTPVPTQEGRAPREGTLRRALTRARQWGSGWQGVASAQAVSR